MWEAEIGKLNKSSTVLLVPLDHLGGSSRAIKKSLRGMKYSTSKMCVLPLGGDGDEQLGEMSEKTKEGSSLPDLLPTLQVCHRCARSHMYNTCIFFVSKNSCLFHETTVNH